MKKWSYKRSGFTLFAQIGSGTQNAGKCNTVVPIIKPQPLPSKATPFRKPQPLPSKATSGFKHP
jgi:hypothetical protein